MKKSLAVLLSIVLLNGCGLSNEKYKDIDRELEEQTKIEESSFVGSLSEESTVEDSALSMIPEWILPYTQIGQLSETIYLNREHTSFFINNDNISFPESTIIIVIKEIAGRDKEAIQDKREDIIEFINHIENAKILSEAETMNPQAQILGVDFSIVLLTVDSEYILLNFKVFDDDRICIDAISEKAENNINIWIKSSEMAKEIKDLTEYKELDSINLDSIEKIELSNGKGNLYQFTGNETEQMQEVIKRAVVKSVDSNCPYDIKFPFYVNGEKIHAKFCNDSCKILAVEGFYFELEEKDANWILDMMDDPLSGKLLHNEAGSHYAAKVS